MTEICLWAHKILEGLLLLCILLFTSFLLLHTAETILTALLSESRAMSGGALCSHPGAELGTDETMKPVNLPDTLACA